MFVAIFFHNKRPGNEAILGTQGNSIECFYDGTALRGIAKNS
jgi:hypothetical protein